MSDSSPKRILVAEDEDVVRTIIGHVLKQNGYEAIMSRDGEEALALIKSRRPDAVILDAMMPGLDGYEVLQTLRNDPNTADIPVMMLSARNLERDVITGFGFGANDYLVKPFRPEELLTRLKRLLGAARQWERDAHS